MEPDSDGYLQYYTKITILGVGTPGYLCSGGTGIAASAVELEEAINDETPRNFERYEPAPHPAQRGTSTQKSDVR